MRYMYAIFGRPVMAFDEAGRGRPSPDGPRSPMFGKFVQVYMDDILILSRTEVGHLIHVRMVLEKLHHHQLYVKASKCQFGRSSAGSIPGACYFRTRCRHGPSQALGHPRVGPARILLRPSDVRRGN